MMHIKIADENIQLRFNHHLQIEWSKTIMDLKMEVKL